MDGWMDSFLCSVTVRVVSLGHFLGQLKKKDIAETKKIPSALFNT